MNLKIIRTRQPPDDYLEQVSGMLHKEGQSVATPDLIRRVHDLPKEDRMLFAVDDDRVLGYAHLRVSRDLILDDVAEVAVLLVRRDVRRRGVGGHLVFAAEAWAREAGRARLLLRAAVGSREMHAFCVALGYEEHGTDLSFSRDLRSARRAEAPTQQL